MAQSQSPLLSMVLSACSERSTAAALTVRSQLEPSAGYGEPVTPASLAPPEGQKTGPRWQFERRWESPEDAEPQLVVHIDQPQSQRQRIGAALEATAPRTGLPLILMDLSGLDLPRHLQVRVSCLRWPHRTADPYLYDAVCEGEAFVEHSVGRALLDATGEYAGALFAWYPTAAAFGFWHSNLGKKRHAVRLAGAFKSEIIGWCPSDGEAPVVRKGLKGDPMNTSRDAKVALADADDRLAGWEVSDKGKDPSEVGMGQIPYGEGVRQSLQPPSFRRITQVASLSFAQLRRLSVGEGDGAMDQAARALVAAVVVHGHAEAFGRPFVLRSGCALSPVTNVATLDGHAAELGDTVGLVREAAEHAAVAGVPLDGWNREPLVVTPNDGLRAIIEKTWPRADEG